MNGDRLLATAHTLPAVENASRALTVPFWMTWDVDLYVPGIDSVSKLGEFTLQAGNPEFFATMGTRIIRGRAFSATDVKNAPLVMVVGESMAKKLWPNQDALGKCVRVDADSVPCSTVVRPVPSVSVLTKSVSTSSVMLAGERPRTSFWSSAIRISARRTCSTSARVSAN